MKHPKTKNASSKTAIYNASSSAEIPAIECQQIKSMGLLEVDPKKDDGTGLDHRGRKLGEIGARVIANPPRRPLQRWGKVPMTKEYDDKERVVDKKNVTVIFSKDDSSIVSSLVGCRGPTETVPTSSRNRTNPSKLFSRLAQCFCGGTVDPDLLPDDATYEIATVSNSSSASQETSPDVFKFPMPEQISNPLRRSDTLSSAQEQQSTPILSWSSTMENEETMRIVGHYHDKIATAASF